MNKKIIALGVCILSIVLAITGVLILKQPPHFPTEDVSIRIAMGNSELIKENSINISINITNNGKGNISREGFCYTFILIFPNGSQREAFCPYNNSMGIISPGGYFEQKIDLLEFSYDNNTWEQIGYLPPGEYSIYAIYNSETNPWHHESIPYDKIYSNTLNFEIM